MTNKTLTLGTCAGIVIGFFAAAFHLGMGEYVSAGYFAVGTLVLIACLARLASTDEGETDGDE